MATNRIVVQLALSDAYDSFDLETGEITSQNLYHVVSCDIDPEKEIFEYQNMSPGTEPWPDGLSQKPFTKKVSEIGSLDDLELAELAARGIEVVYAPPQTT